MIIVTDPKPQEPSQGTSVKSSQKKQKAHSFAALMDQIDPVKEARKGKSGSTRSAEERNEAKRTSTAKLPSDTLTDLTSSNKEDTEEEEKEDNIKKNSDSTKNLIEEKHSKMDCELELNTSDNELKSLLQEQNSNSQYQFNSAKDIQLDYKKRPNSDVELAENKVQSSIKNVKLELSINENPLDSLSESNINLNISKSDYESNIQMKDLESIIKPESRNASDFQIGNEANKDQSRVENSRTNDEISKRIIEILNLNDIDRELSSSNLIDQKDLTKFEYHSDRNISNEASKISYLTDFDKSQFSNADEGNFQDFNDFNKKNALDESNNDNTSIETDLNNAANPTLSAIKDKNTNQIFLNHKIESIYNKTSISVPYRLVPLEIGLAMIDGKRSLQIQLSPQNLGKLDISIDIIDDSKLLARIATDDLSTLALLKNESSAIRQAIEQSGYTIQPDDLQFSLHQENQGNQNRSEHQNETGDQGSQTEMGKSSSEITSNNSIVLPIKRRISSMLDVNI